MARKLPPRKDNARRAKAKIEKARQTGVFQNFKFLVNAAHNLLAPNKNFWQYYDFERDSWLEIACDTARSAPPYSFYIPHIHFIVTPDFVYLNGGHFPFVGHDYQQRGRVYLMILQHFIDMLILLTFSYGKKSDIIPRGLDKKYYDDTYTAYDTLKKNSKAIEDFCMGYCDSIEESQYYNPTFTIPMPVVDEDSLSKFTGLRFPISEYGLNGSPKANKLVEKTETIFVSYLRRKKQERSGD